MQWWIKVNHALVLSLKEELSQFNRDFEQFATAGANTTAGSKFSINWDTAHVRRLHPAVAWNVTT